MDGNSSQLTPPGGHTVSPDASLGDFLLETPGFLAGVLDAQGRMLQVSRGLLAWSGLSAERLFATPLASWAGRPLADHLPAIRRSAEPQEVECTLPGPAGVPRRVRWTLLPRSDGLLALSGVSLPQDQLRTPTSSSSVFADALLAITPSFVYCYDLVDRCFYYVNQELYRFLGYTAEPTSKTGEDIFTMLLAPEDSVAVTGFFERLAAGANGMVAEVDYRLRHADGSYHWISSRGMVLEREPDGQVRQILGIAQDITPRRSAEELHLRLVEIIETTPDLVATIRPNGTLAYLNWAGRDQLGLFGDDLGGLSLRDIFPRRQVEEMLRESIPAAEQDGFWTGESSFVNEQGQEVAVSLVIVAHPSPEAEVEYLSLVARDVSEQRRMEDELRHHRDELERRVAERTAELHRSEGLYRTLSEADPDMVFVVSHHGVVEFANPAAIAYLGGLVEGLVGRSLFDIFPISPERHQEIEQVFFTGQPNVSETKLVIGAEERWINTILAPIRDENGAINSLLGVSRDVTARKQTEDALYRSRQMLQLILDNIPQRVFWKDRQLRYLGGNRPFLSDAGIESVAELLGRVDADLPWRANAEDYRADDRKVLESGAEKLHYEEQQDNHLGEPLWMRTSKIPLRDREGQIFGVLGTYEDITERKRADMLLAARNEELIRSNADLEQFAYIASHDLQEPLRMVTSFAQLFERRYHDQLDQRGEKYLAYIVEGAQRMQLLIDDLLKYSRVGAQGRETRPVNCNAVVKQVLFALQVAVKENRAAVKVEDLPTIQGDETQFFQLFQNLIGNAIKFHREATPQVRVWAERGEGEWRFAVADNGIGIEPQFAERVFVIFQRLHGREEYEGTGIGLAVCKKIVQQYGGRIWLESTLGEGATFYFTIPDHK